MGKYDKLGWHLSDSDSEEVTYTFKEVEDILGFPLPQSAKIYHPWWANDQTHVQASDGWLSHGWKVESIDLREQKIKFRNYNKKGNKSKESKQITLSKNPSPYEFEEKMRNVMSDYYKQSLYAGKAEGTPKLFDMVSEDKSIAGDAKYLTMVGGNRLPPAKFSVIAEHVWLLEKTNAKHKFLVFGNEKKVPIEWLNRYGRLVKDVAFFFFDGEKLEKLL